MIIAEVSQTLVDIGVMAGIISGVLVALALVAKVPPVRWLLRELQTAIKAVWSVLVGRPVTAWLQRVVQGITDPIAADVADLKADVSVVKVDVATTTADNKRTSEQVVAHMQEEAEARRVDAIERRERVAEIDAKFDHAGAELAAWKDKTEPAIEDITERLGRIESTMITKPPPR